MSRLTQRPSVAPLNPWTNISTGNSNQAYSASPTSGTQPSTGTGFYDPSFGTYVGQKFDTSDGRVLTMVANGAAAISAGQVIQSAAQQTAWQGLSMTVPSAQPATAGTFAILVTNGSTVLAVNQFAGGYCVVQTGTGAGQTFKIASHQAGTNAGTFILNLEDPIQTTLDATSKLNLIYNPYGGIAATANGASAGTSTGVIQSPSTITGLPIGVSLYGIATSTAPLYNSTSGALTTNGTIQYGLIVTKGPTGCLVVTTTQVGNLLGPSQATAGALTAATLTTAPSMAISMQTQTSGDYGMVYVTL